MKRQLLILVAAYTLGIASAQEEFEMYGTGLIEDNEAYSKIPIKPALLTRDYTVLPDSFSLRQYCPMARSQGHYGTCAAWASTYAARTIAEAIKWGWTDQKVNTDEAFAPLFVYSQIKDKGDSTCSSGSRISDALRLLKTKGAPKFRNFNVQCDDYVPRWVIDEAGDYTIDDYFTLFNYGCESYDEKIGKTKKALSQKRPVLINMHIPQSFKTAGDVWEHSYEDGSTGYHALCVVGYDDRKAGGAFQIMNGLQRPPRPQCLILIF